MRFINFEGFAANQERNDVPCGLSFHSIDANRARNHLLFHFLLHILHIVCMYNVVYKERVEEEGNNESAIVSPNFSMSLSYGQLSKKSFWLAKELMIWLSKREQTKTFCVTKDRRRETKGFWNCIFNFFSLGTYLILVYTDPWYVPCHSLISVRLSCSCLLVGFKMINVCNLSSNCHLDGRRGPKS